MELSWNSAERPQPREGLAAAFGATLTGGARGQAPLQACAPALRIRTRSGALTLPSSLSRVPDARPMSSRSVRVPQLTEDGSRVDQIGPSRSRAEPSADAAQ